jgi:hypothetical protein
MHQMKQLYIYTVHTNHHHYDNKLASGYLLYPKLRLSNNFIYCRFLITLLQYLPMWVWLMLSCSQSLALQMDLNSNFQQTMKSTQYSDIISIAKKYSCGHAIWHNVIYINVNVLHRGSVPNLILM